MPFLLVLLERGHEYIKVLPPQHHYPQLLGVGDSSLTTPSIGEEVILAESLALVQDLLDF
jgi:hypothetical protein